MIEGKIWGSTETIEANPFCSVHRARFEAGFCCSRHLHQNKVNAFLVISGRLVVRVYQPGGLEDVTELGPGGFTKVEPNVPHRFEGIESGELIEIYWPEPVGLADIVRDDTGGRLA
jgi:mannose-6-phosphate isomerase-like protein (cupin superfamily)